jgi:tRNA pseudouridine55 synthase
MPSPHRTTPIDGALVINKPKGKTSHDVVEAVRRLVGFRQIGHLGTLDPLATGVLVLLLGRATRLAQFYTKRRKRYECVVRFGFATDTFDADGEAQGPDLAPVVEEVRVQQFAQKLVGRIQQVPPAFSAKKIHGRPAHELARKKKPVDLKPVEVEVYEFSLSAIEGSQARFLVECGSGTYIRCLAHELGRLEGSGAHLAEISRTAVGEFALDRAFTVEELARTVGSGRIAECVIPLEGLLHELPRVTVLPFIERRIKHGAKFQVTIAQIQPSHLAGGQVPTADLGSGEWKPARLRVFDSQEHLIAIAEAIVPRTYQPVVVLHAAP